MDALGEIDLENLSFLILTAVGEECRVSWDVAQDSRRAGVYEIRGTGQNGQNKGARIVD